MSPGDRVVFIDAHVGNALGSLGGEPIPDYEYRLGQEAEVVENFEDGFLKIRFHDTLAFTIYAWRVQRALYPSWNPTEYYTAITETA